MQRRDPRRRRARRPPARYSVYTDLDEERAGGVAAARGLAAGVAHAVGGGKGGAKLRGELDRAEERCDGGGDGGSR